MTLPRQTILKVTAVSLCNLFGIDFCTYVAYRLFAQRTQPRVSVESTTLVEQRFDVLRTVNDPHNFDTSLMWLVEDQILFETFAHTKGPDRL